jgi:hypothetical protein
LSPAKHNKLLCAPAFQRNAFPIKIKSHLKRIPKKENVYLPHMQITNNNQ